MELHLKRMLVVITTCLSHVTVTSASPLLPARLNVEPSIIMGYDSGALKRCNFYNVSHCMTIRKLGSAVQALATAGEFVYVGLKSGKLRRCSQLESSKCTKFHELDFEIFALAFSGKDIHVGTTEGITKCGLRKSENCKPLYSSKTPIRSLTIFGDQLYAGSDNYLLNCSLDDSSRCTIFLNTTSSINALTVSGQQIYLGLREGSVKVCALSQGTECQTLYETQSEITDIDAFDKDVQVSLKSGRILRYNFDTEMLTDMSSASTNPVLSMITVYATTPLQRQYIGENKNCIGLSVCPPYVVYYDVKSRRQFEIHIKDNKLYNVNGDLFDTSKVNYVFSGQYSIFVMDSTGRLFASNKQVRGLLHHSSLMSGKPVAAAGEMAVRNGVVMSMTTCSGHYRPSIELVNQVASSLKRQGYNRTVEIINCPKITDLFIDLDFKKTDLYYKAQNERYAQKVKEIRMRG